MLVLLLPFVVRKTGLVVFLLQHAHKEPKHKLHLLNRPHQQQVRQKNINQSQELLVSSFVDVSGKEVDVDPNITHAGNKLRIALPEQIEGLRPGMHTMQVTIMQGDTVFVSNQEFFWGVLAVNLNKSIFKTGEEAYIQNGRS